MKWPELLLYSRSGRLFSRSSARRSRWRRICHRSTRRDQKDDRYIHRVKGGRLTVTAVRDLKNIIGHPPPPRAGSLSGRPRARAEPTVALEHAPVPSGKDGSCSTISWASDIHVVGSYGLWPRRHRCEPMEGGASRKPGLGPVGAASWTWLSRPVGAFGRFSTLHESPRLHLLGPQQKRGQRKQTRTQSKDRGSASEADGEPAAKARKKGARPREQRASELVILPASLKPSSCNQSIVRCACSLPINPIASERGWHSAL